MLIVIYSSQPVKALIRAHRWTGAFCRSLPQDVEVGRVRPVADVVARLRAKRADRFI